jgi:hypothetical protein
MTTLLHRPDVLEDVTVEERDTHILSQLASHWPNQKFIITTRPGDDIGLSWVDGPPAGPVTAIAESAALAILGEPPAWPEWVQAHRCASMAANALAIIDTWRNDRLVPSADRLHIMWTVLPDAVDVEAAPSDLVAFCRAVCAMAGYTDDLRSNGHPGLDAFRKNVARVLHTSGGSIASAVGYDI